MPLFKKLLFTFIIFSLLVTNLLSNETTWTGKWHVFWKHGAIVLTMEQHGNDVNGSYEPNKGTLKGTIKNNKLYAVTTTADSQDKIILSKGKSGNSFFGSNKYGGWVTGIKVLSDVQYNSLSIDDSTPSHTFYSFLKLANQVRSGQHEALEKALTLLLLDEKQQKYLYGKRLLLTRTFFNILDMCTIEKYDFYLPTSGDNYSVILQQMGSDNTVEVAFVKAPKTGKWKMKVPNEERMKKTLQSLLKAHGINEVNPNGNLQLTNPRDTMRTFIEQYKRWKTNGKRHVISTMNLSAIDPAIWDWQAPLLSYYLLGVLDRISELVYQEIPNDPKSKKPFVYFHHPIGDIVIAPYESEGKTEWKFTPDTLASIEDLYTEMEDVPVKTPTKMISDNNLYFTLKNFAQSISPLLIKKFYNTSFWQITMLTLVVFFAGWLSYFIQALARGLIKKFYLTKRWTEGKVITHFLRPIQILTFGVVLLYGAHQLGLSDFLFSFIKTFSHLMIVIGLAWIIFSLIDLIISFFKIRAKKHASQVDEILFSLTRSILRIVVVIVAIFIIAEIFGIPFKTIVAGLGIGGLAFAIAAKETIANFFGSAIIIADRPFKAGDKIKIGENIGVITNVGMRSTTIRTTFDTILTIPNNMITNEMIDNYTAREAIRIDTSFFFALDTSKEILDTLDKDLATYLNAHKDVDKNKIILTGVNDYTKRGISFGVSFFVKAHTDMEYSDIRHNVITEVAEIIKDRDIELVMIQQDTIA